MVATPFNSLTTSSDKAISVAARFSFKSATDEVPGLRRTLGARQSNPASVSCIGVVPRRAATADKIEFECRRCRIALNVTTLEELDLKACQAAVSARYFLPDH